MAECGNDALCCTVTLKVHLMLKHVAWQMENIPGGQGDKMEDFVEQMHQTGIHLRDCFCRVKNSAARAQAREKANSCLCHPNVIPHIDLTNESKKWSFSAVKIEDTITTKRKKQRDYGQFEAMKYFDKDAKSKLIWFELILDELLGWFVWRHEGRWWKNHVIVTGEFFVMCEFVVVEFNELNTPRFCILITRVVVP